MEISALVIKPVSLVNCDVFVGIPALVIKPVSFISSETFKGTVKLMVTFSSCVGVNVP